MFMGEETATTAPFLFFTDHNEELAKAVREGRRQEFAGFSQFSDPEVLARLPDPNALDTFTRSKPGPGADAAERRALYRELLELRRSEIVPRLTGTRAIGARAVGPAAVTAQWQMGDGAILTIACNLGDAATEMPQPQGRTLFATSPGANEDARSGRLAPRSTIVSLRTP